MLKDVCTLLCARLGRGSATLSKVSCGTELAHATIESTTSFRKLCSLFRIFSTFSTLMLEDNMSVQYTLPCVPFRFKILPHKSINMHKQRDKMFALPVHLLRQVTGSAGTAMDVLVTCFSKKRGGSGRRGCKDRAQSGVRGVSRGDSENVFVSRFSFSPNVSKT